MPALRRHGLTIATEGERPARVALAMSGLAAEHAWRFARRRGARLVVYLWDLPPVGTGSGRPDPVWWIGGAFLPAAASLGRVRPAARLLQPPALRRGAGRGGLGRQHAHLRDDRRAIRRRGRSGSRTATTRTGSFRSLVRVAPRVAADAAHGVPPAAPQESGGGARGRGARWDAASSVRLIGRGPMSGARSRALAARLGRALHRRDRRPTTPPSPAPTRRPRSRCAPAGSRASGSRPVEAIASGVPGRRLRHPAPPRVRRAAARLVPPDDVPALAAAHRGRPRRGAGRSRAACATLTIPCRRRAVPGCASPVPSLD